MEQRISVITLGVADLPRSRRFYVDGLGWTPAMEAPGEVIFFNVGPGVVVGLYTGLAAEAGVEGRGPGLTAISQNVADQDGVDRLMAEAKAAGAEIKLPARDMAWGGRSGYFADPDGHLWEVAWNPAWGVGEDGRVQIPG